MRKRNLLYLVLLLCCSTPELTARDYFLTIGGGYSPEGNQASLEKNVLFFQRLLKEQNFSPQLHTVYFADGQATGKDLQIRDLGAIPKANRLMAEFFGTERDLGMGYRNHEVTGVRDSTNPANIRRWFRDIGPTMQRGDRLVLYVTAHGEESADRDNPHNTAISLWNSQRLPVTDAVELLDQLPDGVSVVAIMVQCYTGGFARFIYNNGDPDKGLSKQQRCGFFATVHDRVAAGCTPEVDEATYVEYSTYFWEALGGRTRTGKPIVPPDYDRDGVVSFDEAHAYTVLTADTIDLPLKTSGEFLSLESQFADEEHPQLLPENAPFDVIRALATPSERAILDSLSVQLDLEGNHRIEVAEEQSRASRRGSRRRQRGRSSGQRASRLRDVIADDLEKRWPELSNVLNPGAIELLTTRSQEFVQAVEQHPSFRQYRELVEIEARRPDPQKRRVKFERFVRTTEDVILRENLKRLGDSKRIAQYEAIVAAESTSFRKPNANTPRTAGR
jgi:hypothetical protein